MSKNAIAHVQDGFDDTLGVLSDLIRIPGISASAFPAGEVRRSAVAVASVLDGCGIGSVGLLEVEGGHPAVYGEVRLSPAMPTVLVYGHHDVQPPGAAERWESPPFEPSIRNGRIYGRGTSDDKGGFLAHVAAIRSCLATRSLRCNVKLLIEGEEEIGSPHLAELLARHRDQFRCDYIVLCDTPNFALGVPALTYRLRGNCLVDVEVRCLSQPVHSGRAGGLVPDAVQILCSLLARLDAGDGRLAIPGLYERVSTDPAQLAAMRALPFDEDEFRSDTGVLATTRLYGHGIAGPYERLWAQPSLAVTALEAIPMARAANQIADSACARISLRTVRDLGTAEAGRMLARVLESDPPYGATVTTKVLGGPEWWETDPRHPLFAVARRALHRGFGNDAVMIGSGGSIGFVKPFAELAGSMPPLLTGVQDPASNAHSENESLHLGDWASAMRSAVYLYDELADYRKVAP